MQAPMCRTPSPQSSLVQTVPAIYWEQQRGSLAQKFCFLTLVDLPDKRNSGAVDEREYLVTEVVFIDLVHLGGDLQRHASSARYSNRTSGRFSGEIRPRKAT